MHDFRSLIFCFYSGKVVGELGRVDEFSGADIFGIPALNLA
jgi:hypothetical protein